MKIKFYSRIHNRGKLKYVIIASSYKGKWIYVRDKGEKTFSMPAGHIEEGEDYKDAAKRELYEETGAIEYELREIGKYSVEDRGIKEYGSLFFADIKKLGRLANYEIEEIQFFKKIPEDSLLTYPEVQGYLYKKVIEKMS